MYQKRQQNRGPNQRYHPDDDNLGKQYNQSIGHSEFNFNWVRRKHYFVVLNT